MRKFLVDSCEKGTVEGADAVILAPYAACRQYERLGILGETLPGMETDFPESHSNFHVIIPAKYGKRTIRAQFLPEFTGFLYP
ncbi:hypothetical protein, partial [Aliiruegeria sabulilitoris]|uniref:hypothetical protein n=1 Tax=Aliiruegeria sabulilitoris TaxID=1510458 RepID=UPI001E31F013